MTYARHFSDPNVPPQWKPKLDPETVSELRKRLTAEIGTAIKGRKNKALQVGVFVARGTEERYLLGNPTRIEDRTDGPTLIGKDGLSILLEDVAKYRWVDKEEGARSMEGFYYPNPKAFPQRNYGTKRRVPLMF